MRATEKLVEVKLSGYLGGRWGRSHKFLVSSTREALRALFKQLPGIEAAIDQAHLKGIKFAVFSGRHNIKDVEELEMGFKSTLHIVPVYEGSKKAGVFQTILGAVLIAAAVFFSGPAGLAAGGLWTSVAVAGASMMLGGVAQLLAPAAKGLDMSENADNSASYAFGGPVNTTAQGNPVPLFYGEREVGGAIISAGILAEDQA